MQGGGGRGGGGGGGECPSMFLLYIADLLCVSLEEGVADQTEYYQEKKGDFESFDI